MISMFLVVNFLGWFGLGVFIGYNFRELRDDLKYIKQKLVDKEPELGATRGAYGPVNEFKRTNQDGPVGLVEAKSPQRVQYEAEESLRREARGEK